MDSPKISIVIPSFNQGIYIERTLLSIIKQEYPGEVEIIVSDGGSTDNTVEILKKYNDKITWWSEKDSGYADAVNKGFREATGEIYAIQSSDDYYLKDAFNNIALSLCEHPELSLVCGREVLQEPDGKVIGGYTLPDIITPQSILLDHPFPGIFQHTTFFQRKYYEKAGGMRAEFDMCADADLFFRLLHFGNGRFLDKYTAVYQKHETQRTMTQTLKFRDKLIGMVLSCKSDEFYNKHYCPSEADFDRFRAFIRLFYLQYENVAEARKLAEEMTVKFSDDSRILNLTDQILRPLDAVQKNTDTVLKKTGRVISRIITKYLLRSETRIIHEKPFSEIIDASWWQKPLKNTVIQ